MGGWDPENTHPQGLCPPPRAAAGGCSILAPSRLRCPPAPPAWEKGRSGGTTTGTRLVCAPPLPPHPPRKIHSSSDPAAPALGKPNVSLTAAWFPSPNKACGVFYSLPGTGGAGVHARNHPLPPARSLAPHPTPPNPELGPPPSQDLPCASLSLREAPRTGLLSQLGWLFDRSGQFYCLFLFSFPPLLPNNKLFISQIRGEKNQPRQGGGLTRTTHREL